MDRAMYILLILLLIFLIWLIATNIRIVPQAQAFVLERFGVYSNTWDAGLHIKMPFVERIVRKVSLKEQVYDFEPQPVITKDNVTVTVDSVVFCQISDPKLYCYGIEDPIKGLQNLTATTLRSIIGNMELDETLSGRETINTKMRSSLDEATDPWGLKVTHVEIKNLLVDAQIEEVMSTQMKAERERRQTVLEAQAHQEAVVSRAEGDKKAKILAAEAERDAQIALAQGKAESIRLVYEAEASGLDKLAASNISEPVLRLKGLDSLKEVANGRATKIFMPTDLSSIITSLGVAGESIGIGDATPINKEEKASPGIDLSDPCLHNEARSRTTTETAFTSAEIEKSIRDLYAGDAAEAADNKGATNYEDHTFA